MFSNKKLNETQQALVAALASLQIKSQELAAVQATVTEQSRELEELKMQVGGLLAQLAASQQQQAVLLEKYAGIANIDEQITERKQAYDKLRVQYESASSLYHELEKTIAIYQDNLEIGSFGLYAPQFNFDTSEQFKQAIDANYETQKQLIKEEKAIVCHTEWTVAGSKTEGKKMTTQYKKLMLFAFNGDCESLIARVKWNNVEKTRERVNKAFESINKLGASHQIEITKEYLALKQAELSLTYELEQKKYEEKEEQRRLREQMREEEKAQREFERAQREAEQEEDRYERALEKARKELSEAGGANVDLLMDKVRLLEEQLQEAHDRKERAIAQAQLTKVGHIYVISNIGSFGENVYKLGMTRRLDPLYRVRDLGDASVPFHFDVHAIIYSENAPQLENELHQHFKEHRLNRINGKKEFFRISLDDIEKFVLQHTGVTISFTKAAEAREYRETMTLLEQLKDKIGDTQIMEKFPAKLTA